jgi:5-methylcytosine-specific restriction endonuclease McrA
MKSQRPVYLNEGWTSEGLNRRKWAAANGKCAFCRSPLPERRRIYCSRTCSVKFTEDPRYHRRILQWAKIRAEVLWENKICQICKSNPATEVDHIKEVASGGEPFAKYNLQAVCRICHKRKTALFLKRIHIAKNQITRTSPATTNDRQLKLEAL